MTGTGSGRFQRSAVGCCAAFALFTGPASAATLELSEGGRVSGISGLDFGALRYDVAFQFVSNSELFLAGEIFLAAAALSDAFNAVLNTPQGPGALDVPYPYPSDYRVPYLAVDYLGSAGISYFMSSPNIFSGLWERQAASPGPFPNTTIVETMWAVPTTVVPAPPAGLPAVANLLSLLVIGRRPDRIHRRG